MNIVEKILSFFINFCASLMCPTWDCTGKELNDAGIVKGKIPLERYARNDNGELVDMSDDTNSFEELYNA